MVNPLGLAIATDTVSPFPTVMLEIARVLVVPETLNVPLVAPVKVMSSAVKVVGSTLNVRVKPVELSVPSVPPVCTALSKVTAVGVGSIGVGSIGVGSIGVGHPAKSRIPAIAITVNKLFF